MTIQINPDLVIQQELAARGIDSSVGVFGDHQVQIGKASPIRLDEIKSAAVPSAGFWKATQIQNGKDGVRLTAAEAVGVLLKPGALDAERLLGLLKACQTHLGRLAALGQLTQAQKDDGTWIFTQAVRNLSNADLAAAYQMFSSAEMDLLQTALQREGEINPAARDARKAAEQLFDLQALVLRESANRAAAARLDDLRMASPNDPTLAPEAARLPRAATEQYGSVAGGIQVDAHGNDVSAQSLAVLVETAAASAAERERSADPTQASLVRRRFDDVTVKQIGDVMRSKELTINMQLETFLDRSEMLDHPDRPIDTMWSLKEHHVETKSEGYQQKRDAVELAHFPELAHAQGKGRTRPTYGAVNFQESVFGAAGALYGHVAIVLKPEVARRATYTVNDSFRTVALTVDKKRRETFFALFGGAPGIPDELKLAVADPGSPERKALEEWLDKIEQACRERGTVTSEEFGVESYLPRAVMLRCNEERGDDQALMALVFKCFGDPSATRAATATHDNLESLLPHLGQANSAALAQAAHDRAQGRDAKLYLVGTAYLEAQIHGPVVPERDIAEIRVNLAADPNHPLTLAQQESARARLDAFSRRTGIRVVYIETTFIDDSLATSELSDKAKTLNAAHHDNAAIDQRRDEIIADFPATVARLVRKIPLSGLPEGIDFTLSGKVLDRILEAFLQRLEGYRNADSWQEDSASMVDLALDYVLRPIVDEKLGLVKTAAELGYAEPRQKQAFAAWLLRSGEKLTGEQARQIHRQATAQAALMRTWAAAEPPPTAEAALAAFAALPESHGTDPRHASQVALAFLFSDVPPPTPEAMKNILAILDSAPLRGMTAQIQAAVTSEHLATAADAGRAAALAVGIRTAADTVAGAIRATTKAPGPCLVPLSAIPATVRAAIRQVAPAFADALDAAHPAHPPFPAPANAAALPQNKAQRKQFLLSQMEAYREKELNSEQGVSVHGRGHIIRAYIYANAFCNIMKEQGVTVDRNAVILGITGHDLGRGGLGHDRWEVQSGRQTNQAIRQQYGEGTAGEAWENEVANSIVGVPIEPLGQRKRTVPASPTMEAQLLQSADSLDIGRTGDFDQYYFDFLRDKNGTVSPEAQKIRDQLADEANLLQRLTNPLCANYQTLNLLTQAASDADDDESMTYYQNQRNALDANIKAEMLAQANNSDNQAFIDGYEDVIRRNPQMFPLLTKYYLNGD